MLGNLLAAYLLTGSFDDFFALRNEVEKNFSVDRLESMPDLQSIIDKRSDAIDDPNCHQMLHKTAKIVGLFASQFGQELKKTELEYERKIDGLKRYVKEMEETSRIMGRQNLVLSYFYQAGQMLSSSFDYEHIISSIVEMISTIFNDCICVLITRRENDVLKVYLDERNNFKNFAAYFNEQVNMLVGDGCEGLSVAEQIPCQVFDVFSEVSYKDFLHLAVKFHFQSILSVPLIIKGNSEGCIAIYSPERRFFPEEEIRILTMFSDQAARAIENAQLYQQTDGKLKSRLQELSLRHDIDKAIINNEKISTIVTILLQGIEQVFPGYGFAVELPLFEPPIAMWNRFFDDLPSPGGTLTEFTEEIIDLRTTTERDLNTGMGSISLTGFPVTLQNEPVGAFWVAADTRSKIDFNVMEFVHWILAQLSIALDKNKTLEQLIHAEKMHLLGSLLSGIAHELSNPLTRILGVAETARQESSVRDLKHYHEVARQEALRCKRILEDFLAFSRKYKADEAVVDINEVLKETLQLWRYQKKTDDMKIITNLQKSIPQMQLNVNRMQQVFLNLIVNAYDAMAENNGVAKVLKINSVQDGNSVTVTFRDSGCGIAPENFKKIFQAFFTTKAKGKGTGLGLSLSRDIVREHGGAIKAENHPDGGAQFIIKLPIITGQLKKAKETKALPRLSSDGAHVLILDDDVLILKLMSTFLKKEGFIVDLDTGGAAGLKKIGEREYDIIISDMIMGDLRGDRLVEILEERTPEVLRRLIICTGDVLEQEKTEALESKGVRILYKPFELMELKELVIDVLKSG